VISSEYEDYTFLGLLCNQSISVAKVKLYARFNSALAMISYGEFLQVFPPAMIDRLDNSRSLFKSLSVLTSKPKQFMQGCIQVLVAEEHNVPITQIRKMSLLRHA
jgi:hypothetical protein